MTWQQEHKDRLNAKARHKRATESAEDRAVRLAKQRAYETRRRNEIPEIREKKRVVASLRRRAQPEYQDDYNAYRREWMKSEKGKLSRIKDNHVRRARLRNVVVGPVNFAKILQEAEGLCQLCFGPLGNEVHFDHIIPVAKGGSHTEDNLQATHPLCNRRKGARLAA